MKLSILVIIALTAAGFSAFAETNRPARVSRRAVQRPRRPPRVNGGIFERRQSPDAKPISLVNSQKIVPESSIRDLVPGLRFKSKLPFVLDAPGAPITVELVDREDFGAITLFVEEFKAFVNVRKLAADAPDEAVLLERVRKELFRAGYMAMGSGVTVRGCAMGPVGSAKDLDELNDRHISPDAAMHIYAGTSLGIERLRFTSYRQACEEGWAPQPTNDVQKAIWEEVHAPPEKPLKITYDKDKQKPVVK